MTVRVFASRLAKAETDEVEAFLEEHSPSAARRFVEAMARAYQLLSEHPDIGTMGDRPGTRRLVVGNYIVSYRRRGDNVEIFAVRDARRRDAWVLGGGFLFVGLDLDRAGILALGVGVAVDELDDRHRRVVAIAEPVLDDAGVAASAAGIALGERRQQFFGKDAVAKAFAEKPLPAQLAGVVLVLAGVFMVRSRGVV